MQLAAHARLVSVTAQLQGQYASCNPQECCAMSLKRAASVQCSAMRKRMPTHIQQQEQEAWVDLDLDQDADQAAIPNWGGYSQTSQQVNLSAVPSPQLINAMDKNRLKPHLRHELARRLRREAPELGVLTGRMRVLRLFRFAIDDLRLYKAIHDADMEGRLVVVDDPKQAHVVLATGSTRTGRDVVLDNAQNMAANLGIPFVKLERVSAIQLMTALSPIMGLPIPKHLLERRVPPRPVLQTKPSQTQASMLFEVLQPAINATQRAQPEFNITCDGESSIGEILQTSQKINKAVRTVHQPKLRNIVSARGSTLSVSEPVASDHVSTMHTDAPPFLPTNHMSIREYVQDIDIDMNNATHGFSDPIDFDVDDNRHLTMPSNPTARLGSRHDIHRPIKHGRLAKLRKARKEAALEDVPW